MARWQIEEKGKNPLFEAQIFTDARDGGNGMIIVTIDHSPIP